MWAGDTKKPEKQGEGTEAMIVYRVDTYYIEIFWLVACRLEDEGETHAQSSECIYNSLAGGSTPTLVRYGISCKHVTILRS